MHARRKQPTVSMAAGLSSCWACSSSLKGDNDRRLQRYIRTDTTADSLSEDTKQVCAASLPSPVLAVQILIGLEVHFWPGIHDQRPAQQIPDPAVPVQASAQENLH